MNPDITFELAHTVTRLIDLNIPYAEAAARTGLTEDDAREIEAWARDAPDMSAQAQPTFTATEALVLQCICYVAGSGTPTKEMAVAYGDGGIQEMGESLLSTVGDSSLVNFPSLHDDEPEDDLPDILSEEDEPEDELLDPAAWEGPPSRLLTELLEQERSGVLETYDKPTLHYILRTDTLRVLMEPGDFFAILDQKLTEPPTGAEEDSRWPHSGPIYIEIKETSPTVPEENKGSVYNFIVTEEDGYGTRGVLFPDIRKEGAGTTGVGLNVTTGEVTGIFGSETTVDTAVVSARAIVAFITDVSYEFVEMPLSRQARRRLQRSGAPNPWHVVRRRKGG